MPDTLSPYAKLAEQASLSGPIARAFVKRPGLRAVAQQLLVQQWQARRLSSPHPPGLALMTAIAGEGYRQQSLADALISRYLSHVPVNLTAGLDYLVSETASGVMQRVEVDLNGLERLINESGPLVIEAYQQALIDYWQGTPGRPGPGQWLAEHLRHQLRSVAERARDDGSIDPVEAATAAMIAAFPSEEGRAWLVNAKDTKVWLLNLPDDDLGPMASELLSAVVIERPMEHLERTVVLLFTIAGRLYRFDSMQALAQTLWPQGVEGKAFKLSLRSTQQPVFNAQADLLLECQLATVQALASTATSGLEDPVAFLVALLDEATSFIDISLLNHWEALQARQSLLPRWLVDASPGDAALYVDGLLEVAAAQDNNNERSWLYEIKPALDYARDAIQQALNTDFPGSGPLAVEDLQLVNRQVVAVATGSAGNLVPQGSIKVVTLSLEQLALSNLVALRAGSVEVRSLGGRPLPAGLSVDYLKALVQRLDVGKVYPQLLQRRLLDDPLEFAQRLRIFSEHLRAQLSLLVIEAYLGAKGHVGKTSTQRVIALCHPELRVEQAAVCRPLAFIAKPGAAPDVALNAWLIEGEAVSFGPCLLYRPLHTQALLQFDSRAALLEALACGDELQADILARLEDRVRSIYANGGFEQPHVQRFMLGDDFAPLASVAPVRLGETPVQGELFEQLYRGCAQELIARAKAQSVSNSENRWLGYQELGWLMFNTVMPFLNGPLAVCAWMVQLFASLRDELEHPQSDQANTGLVGLLLNTVMVAIASRLKLERIEPLKVSVQPAKPLPITFGTLEAQQHTPLDFSWRAPGNRLSARQHAALLALRSDVATVPAGGAIPHGPWQGLYEKGGKLFAQLDNALYAITADDEGIRIVGPGGEPGPWLLREETGQWRIDLRLRLRGGMPVGRRIQQLRAANQQRIADLEAQRVNALGERLASMRLLERDIAALGETDPPTPAHLDTYATDLRTSLAKRAQAYDNLKALNQLKTQADFRRDTGQFYFDQAAGKVQLLFVLRQQFHASRAAVSEQHMLNGLPEVMGVIGDTSTQQYQQLVEAFNRSFSIVDELVGQYEEVLYLRNTLQATPPLGGTLIEKLDPMLAHEPPLKAWRSVQLNMLTARVMIANRGSHNSHWLSAAIASIKLGLQMQVALETASGLTLGQQVEVLNSVSRKFTAAAEALRAYRKGASEAQKPLMDRYQGIVHGMQEEVDAVLAGRVRELAEDRGAIKAAANPSHAVIRTRNKGVLLGVRHKGARGRADEVVLTDSIEHAELGRFEESSDSGIWQLAEPAPAVAKPARVNVPRLLSQSVIALQEADQQLARASQQARSISIPVEMEEVLVNQARPLEALSAQIEQALTQANATDTASSGLDAAVQVRALAEKAALLRAEGQRLRVAIILRQPPTAGRVEYLKSLGEVKVTKLDGRIPTKKRKGYAQDYLQEYEIADKAGKPLWYAHLHYASLEAAQVDFTAAHLKTVAQRFEAGQYRLDGERDNQKVIQVYRSQIDRALAARVFFA